MARDQRNIYVKHLINVAAALDVRPGDLIASVGQPAISVTRVPLYSWVSAGAMASNDAPQDASGEVIGTNLDSRGQWIALQVQGDSMDRISPPGSLIFVNRNDRDLVPGGCYVVANELHEATYKRWRPDPSRFEPYSTNPEHAPIIPNGEITVIGRVRQTKMHM
jgi:SOS-response transcriptional repressor LexA